uniref:AlNc14C845G12568 protein n=1 Tax=Albugo laibachii Nc14 TaxID=890382 RepID=F0X257_9STRA|nr:AlNc14C845G12568 [Albugo laibachii Nc14]|eukprot:CCA27931.1 AlNc14C845G12568 [Albugo laibachii Nc14]
MEKKPARTFRSSLGNMITVGGSDASSSCLQVRKSTLRKKILCTSVNEALESQHIAQQKHKSPSPDEEDADPAGYIVHRCSSIAVESSTGDPVTPRKCPPGFNENDKDTKNCVWNRNRSVSSIQFTRPPLMNANGGADHNIWKNDFDQKPELVNSWIDENWLRS